MKVFQFVFIFYSLLFCTKGFANELDDYNKINRASAVLVAYSFNNKLFTQKDIYGEISEEYQNAANEFERQKLEKKYEAETLTYISEVRKTNKFYVTIPMRLAEYDFERKGFPVKDPLFSSSPFSTNGDGLYFSFSSNKIGSIKVDIDNFKKEIFIPLSVDAAEKFAAQLSTSRSSVMEVYGVITKVEEKYSLYTGKTIYLHMQGKESILKLESGEEIGRHSFGRK